MCGPEWLGLHHISQTPTDIRCSNLPSRWYLSMLELLRLGTTIERSKFIQCAASWIPSQAGAGRAVLSAEQPSVCRSVEP